MFDSDLLRFALSDLIARSSQSSDGKWLEGMTAKCAAHVADWDVRQAWEWDNWPLREHPDSGIDVVAQRNDGQYIAIQCKSRQLDEHGTGSPIAKQEINKFVSEFTSDKRFVEAWLVVNGDVPVGKVARHVVEAHRIRLVNLRHDLTIHLDSAADDIDHTEYGCPHCMGPKGRQTRNCMQNEAVSVSIQTLKDNASFSGRARGRIILPCGVGKTRIALRLIEELTEPGQTSVVLVPSIALVAQLRREFLIHSRARLRTLAVCSDETTARGSDLSKDQAADLSHVSVTEIKGQVTTNAEKISNWIDSVPDDRVGVVIGTYQSSHKIAEARKKSGITFAVMVADEAHRTAGIRRVKGQEERLRDFTACHREDFAVTYRIYQTATPKVFKTPSEHKRDRNRPASEWVARSMDDESVFGTELYRRSYQEAVENGWLSDYRIIAIGVNDEDAYSTANYLAEDFASDKANGKGGLSSAQFLRGLALALVMAGMTRKYEHEIKSSINFMNTVAKSKAMTEALQSEPVHEYLAKRFEAEGMQHSPSRFQLRHLDADSNVAKRDEAKATLATATLDHPQGILNVGIFGEGTDAPSLSAVGFIEPRKSPVDVIQAVGRVMRRSPGKAVGYVICPILIPRNEDAELWLSHSCPDSGWQALGQVLMALRAHDARIEDGLSGLLEVYLPPPSEQDVATVVTLGEENGRAAYYLHTGKPGSVEAAVQRVTAENRPKKEEGFTPLALAVPQSQDQQSIEDLPKLKLEPQRIVSGKCNQDFSVEMRENEIPRAKSSSDGTPGEINWNQTKRMGRSMLNGQKGRPIRKRERKEHDNWKDPHEQLVLKLLDQSKAEQLGIHVNLLEQSGLARNKAEGAVNTLEDCIAEAKRCLHEDELGDSLNSHFGLDAQSESASDQADGPTIASLLLMNAAMLHHRIANGAGGGVAARHSIA